MKPLNYAILKYFTKVDEACAEDVIEALKGELIALTDLEKDIIGEVGNISMGSASTASLTCLEKE